MSAVETLLVPTDGSPQAETAFEYALTLPDAEIMLLTVVDPFDTDPQKRGYQSPLGRAGMPGYSKEWYEPAKQRAMDGFGTARRAADERGVSLSCDVIVGDPVRTIVRYATTHGIDHIVIGSHGRSGISRVLFGSVAEKVVRHASVPVTVVQEPAFEPEHDPVAGV